MNKKQVIRINENQLRKIVAESVKRVLKESQYSDLSQDDFDTLMRSANDRNMYFEPTRDDNMFYWSIYDDTGNGFEFDMESDVRHPFQTKEEALKDGIKELKAYTGGNLLLYISKGTDVVHEIEMNDGKIVYNHSC